MKKNIIIAALLLLALQTGCTKPDPEPMTPQPQSEEPEQPANEPLTSLTGTRWHSHREFWDDVPWGAGVLHFDQDIWLAFDTDSTGRRIVQGNATENVEARTETCNIDYIFDASKGLIDIRMYFSPTDYTDYQDYAMVYKPDFEVLVYLESGPLDSVYTRVE